MLVVTLKQSQVLWRPSAAASVSPFTLVVPRVTDLYAALPGTRTHGAMHAAAHEAG